MTKDEVQNKALEIILPYPRSGVGISMGVGKTKLGLMWINKYYHSNIKVLVAAPKLSIIDSWKEDIIKFGYDYMLLNIEFTTYLSLCKQSIDYDLLVLDECHTTKLPHDPWLRQYKGKILGLTGTPPKWSNSENGLMVAKYCPIVYKYITDSAVEDKILNDYKIIVHTLYLDPAKTMLVKTARSQWYASETHTYGYWSRRILESTSDKERQIMNIKRMKAVMEFPSKNKLAQKLFKECIDTGDKCLLFCNTQDQADSLCSHSSHSKNPKGEENLELFKSGKIQGLSCVLQLSEGVNIPNLRSGIIMHAYGNERKASQRIGRFLRLNPDDICTVHVLCYKDTIDEKWVTSALEDFDQSKITWI